MHHNDESSIMTNYYTLLKLDRPLDTNQHPPIQLNNNWVVPQTNQILTVIGYGAISKGGFSSNSLLKVNVPANSHLECKLLSKKHCWKWDVLLGRKKCGKYSCQGESSGPIFQKFAVTSPFKWELPDPPVNYNKTPSDWRR
jgi:Trypsin